jgi:acyl dehydratase
VGFDKAVIGATRGGGSLLVTRSRLRLFAKATGQTDPVFTNVGAARQAGHPDLPVPPTFFFSALMEVPDPFAYLVELGVDLRAVLHGEQAFTYHQMAYAGDELSTSATVVDVFAKKGGALQFMVTETLVANQDGATVATMVETLIERQLQEVRS